MHHPDSASNRRDSRSGFIHLAAAVVCSCLIGLGCGSYLAFFNPVVDFGPRLALVLASVVGYGLVFSLPIALILFVLDRALERTVRRSGRGAKRPASLGRLMLSGVAIVAVVALAVTLWDASQAPVTAGGAGVVWARSVRTLGILVASGVAALFIGWIGRGAIGRSLGLGLATILASAGLVAVLPGPAFPAPEQETRFTETPRVATDELTAMAPRPAALLGFDGMDPKVVDVMIARGDLPNLARLRATGAYSSLATLPTGFSPPIWASFATGVEPTLHGMYDFLSRRLGSTGLDLSAIRSYPRGLGTTALFDWISRTPLVRETLIAPPNRQAPALWTLSTLAGIETCVVDWMATWPSEQLLGTMVSDRAFFAWNRQAVTVRREGGRALPQSLKGQKAASTSPGEMKGICFPEPECRELLPDRAPPERFEPGDPVGFHRAENLFYVEAAERLLGRYRCDFFVFYSHLPDWVNHMIGADELEKVLVGDYETGDAARFAEAYHEVDRTLGRLLPLLGPERTTLVVSDHGVDILTQGERKVVSHGFPGPPGVFFYVPPEGGTAPLLQTSPTIYDVAPTVLAILDLPMTSDMIGRVLEPALDPRGSVRVIQAAGLPSTLGGAEGTTDQVEGVEDDLRDRLRALGYIE